MENLSPGVAGVRNTAEPLSPLWTAVRSLSISPFSLTRFNALLSTCAWVPSGGVLSIVFDYSLSNFEIASPACRL